MDKFDYMLIDEGELSRLGISVERKAERCPDADASARWHCNMVRITGTHLNALVHLVRTRGILKRFLRPDVETILREAASSGLLDLSQVEEGLIGSLARARTTT